MDALPIQEETGAEYASRNDGLMHACGHDGHVAIGLTVARILNEHQNDSMVRSSWYFNPEKKVWWGREDDRRWGPAKSNTQILPWDYMYGMRNLLAGLGLYLVRSWQLQIHLHIRIIGKGGHGAVPNLIARSNSGSFSGGKCLARHCFKECFTIEICSRYGRIHPWRRCIQRHPLRSGIERHPA